MSFLTKLQDEQQTAQALSATADLYLLDAGLGIIGTCAQGESNRIGTSFFDHFPANRVSREEIFGYLRSYPHDVLLTLCGRTPVVFIGTLFAHTGLVVAVLPKGEVKRTLSFPAAFHHVPAHVCVSPSAQMRYKVLDEEAFAEASRWLLFVSAPFRYHQNAEATFTSSLLRFCATRLSSLFGVPLSEDFSGLPALSRDGLDLAFAVGVMLAAFAAASRLSPTEGVRLYAAKEGAPMLYLQFSCGEARDPLDEFVPLLRVAVARGAILDVVSPQDAQNLVQVRACFGVVELSAQGVRERHRFLEGKSPLGEMPSAHALPYAFLENSFD